MALNFPDSPSLNDTYKVGGIQWLWNGTTWIVDYISRPLVASGGTEVTSGGYKYHTFTSSGTLTVSKAGVCEVLVVAGGGAGRSTVATQPGPGGGAGGLINASDIYLAAGSHTVTVGAGGTGASSVGVNNCTSGSESSIGSLTAVGGAACQDRVGTKGGAGSGGGTYATPGDGVSGQGNSGGGVAGGGGGAGAAGTDGYVDGGTSLRYGGNGGDGLQFSAWATATSTGDSGYYAGGGGGAYGDFAGTGGAGGGGDAQSNSGSAQSGTANTGGGGGGAELNASPSGNGGSGIVIVRYAV